MNLRFIVVVGCGLVIACGSDAAGQARHEAVDRYKAFMAAVVVGDVAGARKLVEAVPKEGEEMVDAGLRLLVSGVALKRAVTAQMGLPGPKDEDELGERGLAPGVLEGAAADAKGGEVAVVHSKDPEGKAKIMLGVMVRRAGKWFVSAALLTDQWMDEEQKAGEGFRIPPAEERRRFVEYARGITKAMEAVLARVKKKEFKTRAEVVRALVEAMPKDRGEAEIDVGGC